MIPRTLLFLGLLVLAAPPQALRADDDRADGERTAVVISLDKRRQLPEIGEMQSWFVATGQPAKVLAVDRGPAEVIVVRDPSVQPYLDILTKGYLDRALGLEDTPIDLSKGSKATWDPKILQLDEQAFAEAGRASSRNWRQMPPERLIASRQDFQQRCGLGDDTRLQFLSPLAAQVSRIAQQTNVFNLTHSIPVGPKGFLTFVESVPSLGFARRFADAVAVAADELETTARRRAVVVLVEGASQDESLYSIPVVRQHLELLQIPVFVWWFGHGAFAGGWDTEHLISEEVDKVDPARDLKELEDACADLTASLEAQRIVWLEGLHLLEDIELSPAVKGVQLAGEVSDDD